MRQPWLMSLAEAVTNVAVGYSVAVVTQLLVFPMFGLATTRAEPRDQCDLHHGLAGAELRAAAGVRGVPSVTAPQRP